jgi:PAS domain S-box-containing protein
MPHTQARLLIIDDEKALMKALCDTLEAEGYRTMGFTSAREALATLRDQSFDVVLTDLMMPEMDGISVLDAAFRLDSNLVGIIMTGHGSVNTAVNALQTGAVDYILKPFKVNTILPMLARALAARRLRMENIQLREAVGLYELSLAIASARNSEAVLEKVADAAFEQSDAQALYVLLTAESALAARSTLARDELQVAAVRGAGAKPEAGARLPFSPLLQDWAANSGQPDRGPEELPEPGLIAGLPPGLSIPMLNGGKLLGVLHFEPPHPSRSFTRGQRKALSILASTGASALAAADGVERLSVAEERYRRLAEDAPDIVSRYEVYPEPGCSYANPAILAATGYTPEEFYADPGLALRVVHPDDLELANRTIAGQIERGTALTLRLLTKSGATVWVEQRVAHVHDRHGRLVAIETVARDVTERRNLEERLRHSQKLEAIGKLTAGVAQDFNNLLTIINGYCALGLTEVEPGSPTSRKLDQIKKAGDQAAALTNQLLAFSRKQVLQPRTINLALLLGEMEQMIRRITGDSIELSIQAPEGLGDVRIDPTQAQQVILNLAVNARDAMAGGGTLTFTLSNHETGHGEIRIPGMGPGNYVKLTVTDTGCGMTPELRQRVFEPFFTTKDIGRGTGLGLATVHGIVEQSHGHIYIDSEPGLGTTFTILLPRAGGQSELPRPETAPMSRGTETILLVDDDHGVRSFTHDVLTGAGYAVLAAADGVSGLRLAEEYGDRIDLLITDMSLPGMLGGAVAEKVRDLLPHARILFISGYTDSAPPQLDPFTEAEADFLAKPFTPAQLTTRVREVLNAVEPRPLAMGHLIEEPLGA